MPTISQRFCTKTTPGHPLFFIGSSPSMAIKIVSPDFPASGVMVSVNQLRDRKSDFDVRDWILDSGAFTEISKHGSYRYGIQEYYSQILRWSRCGNLLAAVSQDWMCEPFMLRRTGLTIAEHQRLTIERYDQLIFHDSVVPIMPVLQGYRVSDYLKHLADYGDRLTLGAWVGVGSVCRRNSSPFEVADILKSIKLLRPDLRLHGFGLKILALENTEVRELLYSHDSMAWSYPRKFMPTDIAQNHPPLQMAHDYQQSIHTAGGDSVRKRIPRTAGAGNGQGRKSSWKSPTIAIRVPEKYAQNLISLAREWEKLDSSVHSDKDDPAVCAAGSSF